MRMPGELRRGLGVARGATATPGAGVKFLDDSAQAPIGLPSIVRACAVHNLVAMVVHLDFALRTNHFVGISHSNHPRLLRSVQSYLFAPLAQCLCHPNEFLQKLINAPDVGLVEEFAVLGKHLLHT